MKVLVINGPNLNMLGKREPEIYGSETLEDINSKIIEVAKKNSATCDFFQSNCECEIINKLHNAISGYDGVIINAGAYTHYSYAIADALKMLSCIKVEVHMSNIFSREEFRHKSVIAPCCTGSMCGFGSFGYIMALKYIVRENL